MVHLLAAAWGIVLLLSFVGWGALVGRVLFPGGSPGRADRTIDPQVIAEPWDRMGQFYASLEGGHATASVALKLSPIEWENVILYGQYVLDRAQVR